MVQNDVYHQLHSGFPSDIFRIGFLDAPYHLSSFWTKLTEIGGTPKMRSAPKWPKNSLMKSGWKSKWPERNKSRTLWIRSCYLFFYWSLIEFLLNFYSILIVLGIRLSDSNRIPFRFRSDSDQIPIGLPLDSHRIPIWFPSDSHQMPIGIPSDSHRIPDSHQTSNGLFGTSFRLFRTFTEFLLN